MNGYFPKDRFNQYRLERLRVESASSGLRRRLALLELEERFEAEKLKWELKNAELRERALESLSRLYHEKRLRTAEEFAREELAALKLNASETARAFESYLASSPEGKALQRRFNSAIAESALPPGVRAVSTGFTQPEPKPVAPYSLSAGGQLRASLDRELDESTRMMEEFVLLGRQIGSGIADGIREGEPVLRASLKSVLASMLDFLERFAAAAQVQRALESYAFLGPLGLVKTAAETALITALLETARSKVLGFAEGGIIKEPVVGVGTRTLNRYVIGEEGPEAVLPLSNSRTSFSSRRGEQSSNQNNEMLHELQLLRRDLNALTLNVRGSDLVLAVERATASRKELLR